ncbi:MAG: cofactor-independent phosphoglycerate mutase [Desulfoarculaceae bacterium]|nr:cofactor-independent phosphoglycerate mutase [Desulfoarculaceae bacterium]
MKYLILVGDGMGDLPMAELNNRTPLEAADTPFLDALCRQGELFLTRTIPEGYPPGSDVANLSLLGYRPEKYYTGRAPLEAAAMGLRLTPEQTAFRCNMVTLAHASDNEVRMIDHSAGHISSEESHQLIAALEEGCASDTFHFHAGVSYRHILMVEGKYPQMNTVPPHDFIGKEVTIPWARYHAHPQWATLLDKAQAILADHPINVHRVAAGKNPANGIWLWGEGKLPAMPTLMQSFGLSGSLISAVDLLKGLGINAGLSIINVPGATGYLDTNYAGKVLAALESLRSQDFVFVHVEAPDEAGHQGSLQDKIQAIEDFDQKIVGPIFLGMQDSGEEFRLIATMDHFTPLCLRTHTVSAVPTILYDSRKTKPGCNVPFSERSGEAEDKRLHNEIANGELLMEKLLERHKHG